MMFHQVSRQFLKKSTIDPDRQYDSIWDYTVIFTYLVFPFLCSCLRLLFFCYFIKSTVAFFKAEMMNPASSGADVRRWAEAVDARPLATALQRPIVIVFPHGDHLHTVHYRPGLSTEAVFLQFPILLFYIPYLDRTATFCLYGKSRTILLYSVL